MEATHHCSDGYVENLGDLLVGESFHVAQQHGHAELLREGLDGFLDLGFGEVVEHLVLGAAAGGGASGTP